MTRLHSKIFAALGLAAAIAIGLAAPAAAGDERAPRGGGNAGLQVAIDPATRQIRQPTAAEMAALSAQSTLMTKAAGAPMITTFADGTISAVLTTDYLNVWLAAIGADGSLGQICVDGADAATAQPAASALEEK
jgi:hypothetical protein